MIKKKITLTIISIIFAIILITIPNKVKAKKDFSTTPLYFGVNEFRNGTTPEDLGYAIHNPYANGTSADPLVGAKIWQIKKYNSSNSEDGDPGITGNYYCVRAGVGFSDTNKRATYTISYDLKTEKAELEKSSNIYLQKIATNGKYNNLLALTDILYLHGISTENDKKALLDAAEIYTTDYYPIEDAYYTVTLTDSDIEVVQQAAIWYYTNFDDVPAFENIYNNFGKEGWLFYRTLQMSQAGEKYKSLSDYDMRFSDDGEQIGNGLQRQEQAEILFDYLIRTANANSSAYANGTAIPKTKVTLYTNETVQNTQPIISIEKIQETPGNYRLTLRKKDANWNTLASTTKFTVNGEEKVITTGELEVVNKEINSTNYQATDIYTIRETQAPNGYIGFTGTITVTVTKKKENNTYKINEMTYKVTDESGKDITNANNSIRVYMQNEHIYVEVKNHQNDGKYNLTLVKEDENGVQLNSTAVFEVNGIRKEVTGRLEVATNVQITASNVGTTDRYVIKELTPPDEYCEFDGIITIEVTKKNENGTYKVDRVNYTVTDKDGNDITTAVGEDVKVHLNDDGNIYVEVKNYPESKEKYNLTLIKEDENGEQLDSKAIFEVNGEQKEVVGRLEIAKDVEITAENVSRADVYTIKELVPPDEYCKFDGTITITVTKKYENRTYKVDEVTYKVTDKDGNDITTTEEAKVYFDRDTGNIYVEVKNYQNNGKYNLTLVKEDENGEQLDSKAIFEVNGEQKEVIGRLEIAKDVEITAENVTTADIYTIKELVAPDEYCEFNGTITITVTKKNENGTYKVDKVTYKVTDENGKDITEENKETVNVYLNENGNIYVEVKNYQFDLKLIKRIVEVNGVKVPERINNVDITELAKGTETTAKYDLNKEPISVKKGDIVKYTLRIYNEGSIDGYASEITEDIPDGLEFIWSEKTESELDADTTLTEQEKQAIKYNQLIWNFGEINKDTNKVETVTTNYLAKGKGAELTNDGANLIKAFDPKKEYKNTINDKNPDYKEISVYMKVVSENETGTIIRNEAAITEDTDSKGNTVDDRDSDTEKWVKYEDDEDYDRIILQSFDLSLRKFIIAVSKDDKIEDTEYLKNEDGTYKRAPQVDTSKLNTTGEDGKLITTATYNHTKEPIEVTHNDYVVYMIRVYNEGDIDGYASEITDHLPPYLQYVDNEFNKQYGWNVSDNGRTVKTKYLENHIISKTTKNAQGEIILSYKEIPIMCKVTSNAQGKITNIADITEYKDENKKEILDRDSEEDNVKLPEDKDLPNYKDDEKGDYIPGQQDDDDFEKLVVKTFDLALRKFITGVNNQNVTNRIPQVKYDTENNKITYEHTKTPVDVVTGDTVIYTIRVYNEGDINGYASEVSDDIPDGLQYLPDNSINKEYRWIMYDKNGKETTDISKAVKITTDYLSKEQGEARMKNNENGEETEEKENPALLKAFDKNKGITESNPDYADVKVAFKVIEPNSSDKIIINSAQISEDTDEEGNPVDDIDSTPDVWNEGEDDQDKEYIKLNYFDLALRKWVTHAIVIENGKETVTQTGHKPEDDPEQVVKVELDRKKLNSLIVKFKYSIRITNEGDIAGYAKEITDYVPQGLKFVAADNPDWVDKGNNVITTRKLENKLLQPGESADVEVILTWINNSENMGLKVNTAEISEDYNDRNVPDRDSTPNNKKPGEDDIDDAPVLLSITTGQKVIYFTLGFSVLMTLSSGIILIRKFVL